MHLFVSCGGTYITYWLRKYDICKESYLKGPASNSFLDKTEKKKWSNWKSSFPPPAPKAEKSQQYCFVSIRVWQDKTYCADDLTFIYCLLTVCFVVLVLEKSTKRKCIKNTGNSMRGRGRFRKGIEKGGKWKLNEWDNGTEIHFFL